MDFSILGPLEVRHDGVVVPIHGRHAPKLLAVLLLDAGRLITVVRLVETLWGDDPPATARRQVQNVMAALRRDLPVPDVIEANTSGYRLSPDGVTVDYREFVRLRAEAGRAEPREALRCLTEALRLWRGEALAGLSGRVLEAAAAKLDEERLAAVEDRAELALELDRSGDIANELRELAETHPYRQRLAGLLMRALWYAGQATEALDVFERLRGRLAEDLGLDPTPELTRLRAEVMGVPPEPGVPRAVVPPGVTPAQLPAAPTTFTGRRDYVAELDGLLEQGGGAAVVSAIAGMGGAGKTALALHWGHRVRQRFPDGQLYINLRGYDEGEPVAPIDALGRFLVALGQPSTRLPTDVDSAAALFRTLLAKRRVLVVLDNARTVEQVRPMLPGGAGNFALVTSRDRMTELMAVDGTRPIRLDMLSREESLELLANIVGARRLHDEPDQAQHLAELCGRLPLALRIAAAIVASRPQIRIAEFNARLEGPGRLTLLAIDDDPMAAVTHTLDLSYAALDRRSQELLLRLACIPGADFSHDLSCHVSELAAVEAENILAKLVSAHLVEQHAAGRYRFHDLTREYAQSRATEILGPTGLESVRTAHIAWHHDKSRALEYTEIPNIVSALKAWSSHPDAWKLAKIFATFVNNGMSLDQLVPVVAEVIKHAQRRNDIHACATLHHTLALTHRELGNRATAIEHGDKAVALGRRFGLENTAQYLLCLGVYLTDFGLFKKAEPLLQQAIAGIIPKDSKLIINQRKSSLGCLYRAMGRFKESERLLLSCLADEPQGTNLREYFGSRYLLSELYLDMGHLSKATPMLRRLRRDAAELGFEKYEILTRKLSGEIHRRHGHFDSARQDLLAAQESATLSGRVGLEHGVACAIAELEIDVGEFPQAHHRLRRFTSAHGHVLGPFQHAEIDRLLCLTFAALGDITQAVTYGERARDGFAAMPEPLRHARSLLALSRAHGLQANSHTAISLAEAALDIFTRLGVPEADEVRQALAAAPPP